MANRSDFQSILPRSIKRMLSLSRDLDQHRIGEVRRLFIEAHKKHQEFKGRRLDNDVVKEIKEVAATEVVVEEVS